MKRHWMWAVLFLLGSTCASAQQKGEWVLAQWQGGEYWFPGVIESIDGSKVTIAYDDGTRETRPLNQVRPYDWKVGSRIQCQWNGGTAWYAGRITKMGTDGVTLHVAYDDGDSEQTRTGACRSQ